MASEPVYFRYGPSSRRAPRRLRLAGRYLSEMNREELLELSDGLEHAARVIWCEIKESSGSCEPPFGSKDKAHIMVQRLSRASKELREEALRKR